MARTKPTAKKVRHSEQVSSHDGLFHRTFSVPRHAASELRSILPPELVARIQWDKLRAKPDKFVDAQLTNRFSDVLFEVEINGEEAFIYVLFEHKSEPEKWTLLQLLEYMVRIWRAHLRERSNKPVDRLPIILPVVLHHGEKGWTAPRRFAEYFGKVSKVLHPFIVDFGIFLDDVVKVDPDALLMRPLTAEAKLVLLCLLLGRTPRHFFAELPKWHGPISEVWYEPEGSLLLATIIVYMERVGRVPRVETTMALQHTLKLNPAEEIIFADKILKEQVLRDGRREGRRKGKIEGALVVLTKLLEQRFGPLPTSATTRLQTATQVELEQMALRVLSAKTLDDVLEMPKRPATRRSRKT